MSSFFIRFFLLWVLAELRWLSSPCRRFFFTTVNVGVALVDAGGGGAQLVTAANAHSQCVLMSL